MRYDSNMESVTITVYLSGRFGSTEERDLIQAKEDEIGQLIETSGVGMLDGHGSGQGQYDIFLLGKDAEKLVSTIRPILDAWQPPRGGQVTVELKNARQH